MIFRGLLGAGLIWLAAGHGPGLGLPQPGQGDTLRQASDTLREQTLESLAEVRQQLQANNKSPAGDMHIRFLVAGKGDGEAALLTGRLATTDTP
jgi:hypothetical protein